MNSRSRQQRPYRQSTAGQPRQPNLPGEDDGGRLMVRAPPTSDQIRVACDWIVVIRFGELVFSGPIGDLLARSRGFVDIRAEDDRDHAALAETLTTSGWRVEPEGGGLRVLAAPTPPEPRSSTGQRLLPASP